MNMTVINYIDNLTFTEFQNIINHYEIGIEEEDSHIIYSIIKNNIFALLDDQYHDILYHYIQKKTSISTCQKIRKLISEYKFYFKVPVNV
ncbi:MAG: hypothetical protein ACK5LC_12345 [Coprobacillaceae bacterium]